MKAKFLLGVGALLGVAMSPITTNAEELKSFTVQDLYRLCKSTGTDRAFCNGVIAGAGGEMRLNKEIAGTVRTPADRLFITMTVSMCGNAPIGAGVQAFINWAEKHPERWTSDMLFGVNKALSETWPCR
jgi:hypothetical protein